MHVHMQKKIGPKGCGARAVGFLLHCLFDPPLPYVLLIGPDNAGKTTLLHSLKRDKCGVYPPTSVRPIAIHCRFAGMCLKIVEVYMHVHVRIHEQLQNDSCLVKFKKITIIIKKC